MGMGMGGIGKADDLSAIYHNPAGLTQLKGNHVYLGIAGISPASTYTRTGFDSEDTEDDLIPVPTFVFSTDFNGRLENVVVAVGVNAPFGLRSEYDELGAQRYMSTDISLTTVYTGPYIAWQITPKISIGGGIQYVYGTAEVGQHVNYGGLLSSALNENPDYDGVFDVKDATDHQIAGNVGVLLKPRDDFQIGLSWRSGVDLDLEGDATLGIPSVVTQLSGGLIQSLTTDAKTTVCLPQQIGVGVAYNPIERLTLTADFNWLEWSVYENLDFDFKDNTSYFPDKENPRHWDDTIVLRFGAEYWLNDRYAIRAGYIYDESPMPDETHGPELPTSTRNSITLGFGYKWRNMQIDLAYAHLFIDDRTVTESERNPEAIGTYESEANIFGISLAYAF